MHSHPGLAEPRTKALVGALGKLGWGSALIVTGAEVERNFGLASRNLIGIDVLPSQGLNVYESPEPVEGGGLPSTRPRLRAPLGRRTRGAGPTPRGRAARDACGRSDAR